MRSPSPPLESVLSFLALGPLAVSVPSVVSLRGLQADDVILASACRPRLCCRTGVVPTRVEMTAGEACDDVDTERTVVALGQGEVVLVLVSLGRTGVVVVA